MSNRSTSESGGVGGGRKPGKPPKPGPPRLVATTSKRCPKPAAASSSRTRNPAGGNQSRGGAAAAAAREMNILETPVVGLEEVVINLSGFVNGSNGQPVGLRCRIPAKSPHPVIDKMVKDVCDQMRKELEEKANNSVTTVQQQLHSVISRLETLEFESRSNRATREEQLPSLTDKQIFRRNMNYADSRPLQSDGAGRRTNTNGGGNSATVYENLDNLHYASSSFDNYDRNFGPPPFARNTYKRSVTAQDNVNDSNNGRSASIGNNSYNIGSPIGPFFLSSEEENVNRQQSHSRIFTAPPPSSLDNNLGNRNGGLGLNNHVRGTSSFSNSNGQQNYSTTPVNLSITSQNSQLLNNLTLNNQGPPGMRANNYWDNFRSYSRQNMLSSPKLNGFTNGTSHVESRNGCSLDEPNNIQAGPPNTASRPDLVLNRNPVGNGSKIQLRGAQFVENIPTSKKRNKDQALLPCRSNSTSSIPGQDEQSTERDRPGTSSSSSHFKIIDSPGSLAPSSDNTEANKELAEEVAQFIRQNSERPSFIVELLRKVSLLETDFSRHRVLNAIQDVVNQTAPLVNLELESPNSQQNSLSSKASSTRKSCEGCGTGTSTSVGGNNNASQIHHPQFPQAVVLPFKGEEEDNDENDEESNDGRGRELVRDESLHIEVLSSGLTRITRDCRGRVPSMSSNLLTVGSSSNTRSDRINPDLLEQTGDRNIEQDQGNNTHEGNGDQNRSHSYTSDEEENDEIEIEYVDLVDNIHPPNFPNQNSD